MRIFPHVPTFSDPFLKSEAEKFETTSKTYLNAGENKSLRQVHKYILDNNNKKSCLRNKSSFTSCKALKGSSLREVFVFVKSRHKSLMDTGCHKYKRSEALKPCYPASKVYFGTSVRLVQGDVKIYFPQGPKNHLR